MAATASQLDLTFHALADPARRAMVERLSLGPASVSELAKPLAMSLPAVVQHLHVLEDSGLVRSEKVGRVRTCRIEPRAMTSAEQWIAERRRSAIRTASGFIRCFPGCANVRRSVPARFRAASSRCWRSAAA